MKDTRVYNEFKIYSLTNYNSIYGFPFIALNNQKTVYISFYDEFAILGEPDEEILYRISNDYADSKKAFEFNMDGLDEFMKMSFKTNQYSMLMKWSNINVIKELNVNMHDFQSSHEVEFSLPISENAIPSPLLSIEKKLQLNSWEVFQVTR